MPHAAQAGAIRATTPLVTPATTQAATQVATRAATQAATLGSLPPHRRPRGRPTTAIRAFRHQLTAPAGPGWAPPPTWAEPRDSQNREGVQKYHRQTGGKRPHRPAGQQAQIQDHHENDDGGDDRRGAPHRRQQKRVRHPRQPLASAKDARGPHSSRLSTGRSSSRPQRPARRNDLGATPR